MHHFSIKDIENLCGIKAHTLRIWEQRYQLCVAKRKASQHRIYDNNDLKELLQVSFLYHNGYKISNIAGLSLADIEKLVEETYKNHPTNHEGSIHQLTEASLDFDKERFEKIINCLVLRTGIENSIRDVFYPFLQRIGLLWMTNHAIPAQEHFASHIIRKKIILATDGLETPSNDKNSIVIFSPSGEYHEIPLLTANYFFRKEGNKTLYFGTNVSVNTLTYYLNCHPAEYVYAHIITCLSHTDIEDYISALRQSFKGKIVFSGPACRFLEESHDLIILNSLEELVAFSKKPGVIERRTIT